MNQKIDKIGLHHNFHEGRTLYHVFSVVSGTLFLRLKLDTDNLLYPLEGPRQLSPILSKLVEKMGARLRAGSYAVGGVHLAVGF